MSTPAQSNADSLIVRPSAASRVPTRNELRKVAARLVKFATFLAVIWAILYYAFTALPYTRPGTDLIYDAKIKNASSQPLFTKNLPNRVLIFGNSMVLAGFIPDEFDQFAGARAESYNLGLPDEVWFLGALQKTLENGTRPTHVIYTVPWTADQPKKRNIFTLIENDSKFLDAAFPFRHMPRNLTLFAIRSRSHDGLVANYQFAQNSVDQMIRDRGYYFIEGMSHYATNALPEDLTFDGDQPAAILPRNVITSGSTEFSNLCALAEKYDFQVYLCPFYMRQHAWAEPAPINQKSVAALQPYSRMHVLGPDYFQFPNKYFSDHIHANRAGAEVYTRKLYDLLAPTFVSTSAPSR